jgi:hypothetical protein
MSRSDLAISSSTLRIMSENRSISDWRARGWSFGNLLLQPLERLWVSFLAIYFAPTVYNRLNFRQITRVDKQSRTSPRGSKNETHNRKRYSPAFTGTEEGLWEVKNGFWVDGRLFGSCNNIYFEFCVRIVCQIPRILRFGKTANLTHGQSVGRLRNYA